MAQKKLNIGIVGCGAIGQQLALFLDSDLSRQVKIIGICDQDDKAARILKKKLKASPAITDIKTLLKKSDIVVEAASQQAALQLMKETLGTKTNLVILSVGSLVYAGDLLGKLQKKNIKVWVPSGAICGLDAVGALGLGTIRNITITTRKPPKGLAGAGYLEKKRIDVHKITEKTVVFQGSVRQAIQYFPKNINVAATLLTAATQYQRNKATPPKVKVRIKVDPGIKRNIHQIEIDSKQAHVMITVQNRPSEQNPKTSALTVLSTQYLFVKMFSPIKIGS